jgi:ankyrin repeat protein
VAKKKSFMKWTAELAVSSAPHKHIHSKFREMVLKITKLLIQYKSDINARDISNQTPLHFAAVYGDSDIMELLVSNLYLKKSLVTNVLHKKR